MSQLYKSESSDKYKILRKKETALLDERNELSQTIKDSCSFDSSFVSGF